MNRSKGRAGALGSAVVVALLLSACSGSSEEVYDETSSAVAAVDTDQGAEDGSGVYGWGDAEPEERADFDEDAAREAAEEEIAAQDYVGIGSPYGCSDNCSGHEAGFRYRADNGYVSYGNGSDSFQEGGQAFEDAVEARVEEMRAEHESGEDSY